jgi:hypothetical protein
MEPRQRIKAWTGGSRIQRVRMETLPGSDGQVNIINKTIDVGELPTEIGLACLAFTLRD